MTKEGPGSARFGWIIFKLIIEQSFRIFCSSVRINKKITCNIVTIVSWNTSMTNHWRVLTLPHAVIDEGQPKQHPDIYCDHGTEKHFARDAKLRAGRLHTLSDILDMKT